MIKLNLDSRYCDEAYIEFLTNNDKVKNFNPIESSHLISYEIPDNSICLDDINGLVIVLRNTNKGIKVLELESNKVNIISSYQLTYLSSSHAARLLKQQRKQYLQNLHELQQIVLLLEAAGNLV